MDFAYFDCCNEMFDFTFKCFVSTVKQPGKSRQGLPLFPALGKACPGFAGPALAPARLPLDPRQLGRQTPKSALLLSLAVEEWRHENASKAILDHHCSAAN